MSNFPREPTVGIIRVRDDAEILRRLDHIQWLLVTLFVLVAFGMLFLVFMFAGRTP